MTSTATNLNALKVQFEPATFWHRISAHSIRGNLVVELESMVVEW